MAILDELKRRRVFKVAAVYAVVAWLIHGQAHVLCGHDGANDLWMMSPHDPGDRKRLLEGPFNEADAALSPDGNWLAFSSNDTDRYEIYLTRYPPDDTRLQINR